MFLGIDGGGTKTAFVLLDAQGRLLARAESGSSYHPEVGIEGVGAVLHEGANAVLQAAGTSVSKVRHAFFGIPAYGEDPVLDPALAALPGALFLDGQYSCGNDMVCGWAGALACRDGINITAGTGSIAYGEYAGRQARAGGWGEIFGDEGSAYWIGREALALFSRMADGRLPAGPLLALVRSHFELRDDLALAGLINSGSAAARSRIAQLSRIAAEAARAGDAGALEIFKRSGQELAALAYATRAMLAVPAAVELAVSWSGGVFSTGELILTPFTTALAARPGAFRPVPPQLPPAIGAALYAAHCTGVSFTSEQLQALAHSIS